jgi:hypothetical protein
MTVLSPLFLCSSRVLSQGPKTGNVLIVTLPGGPVIKHPVNDKNRFGEKLQSLQVSRRFCLFADWPFARLLLPRNVIAVSQTSLFGGERHVRPF